ncbi:helix-turn-helix domain-containing protein [Mycolicibacterium mucogenicum]|uniref:helix-turn-helix domain-containing protein n=1 Tax=Mycolicibacterium mucogenicum TaxID=56689 RepID=UPI00197B6B68|nr:helix-turn-helix domain-containing protein [Mycolicibacterium mucogenicum]
MESQCDAGQAAAYDLVDVKEAAGILGCSPANVRDLIARGRLAGHRAGRNWLLPARVVVERAERRAARHAG